VSTTIRNYSYALLLEDQGVADDIEEMLRTEIDPGRHRSASATADVGSHEGPL
jgi:hypothetical protein